MKTITIILIMLLFVLAVSTISFELFDKTGLFWKNIITITGNKQTINSTKSKKKKLTSNGN